MKRARRSLNLILLGSAGARSLGTFGITQADQQDGCDTEAFHFTELSPRPGEAQVQPALQAEKATAPRTQRSVQRTHRRGYRDEAAKPPLRLPQDCRANIESFRCRDQSRCRPTHTQPALQTCATR